MIDAQELLKGKKILVIDDALLSRAFMKNVLYKAGCKVLLAKDAFEGWYLIKAENPDVAIIDIAMPFVDGLTLFDYIRRTRETN